MRAYELQHKPGLDSVTRIERPDPRPGPGEVLIRMRAWSLNFRDLSVARGAYGGAPTKGLIPLSDGVGEIVEVGAGVTRVKPGDRVAGIFMQGFIAGGITAEALATARGGAIDGVLSEYVVLSQQGVVQVPTHLTDEEAAALPCAAVIAQSRGTGCGPGSERALASRTRAPRTNTCAAACTPVRSPYASKDAQPRWNPWTGLGSCVVRFVAVFTV